MKKLVQVVAGLNALFQVLVGLLSIASPLTAAEAFKVDASAPATLALIRMFGGLLASSGLVSALVARDPARDRGLILVFAGSLVLNVVADGVVIGAGEMGFGQLAAGMVLELALAVLLVVYRASAPRDVAAAREGDRVHASATRSHSGG